MGLIEIVGDWVLVNAVKQFKQWTDEGLPVGRLAINVSPLQVSQPSFAGRVQSILEAYGVPASGLEIEITESAFFEDLAQSNDALQTLREAGIRVSIDDFGTGYSSFSYLRDLQFDTLKIDQAFVRDIPDRRALAIAKAIVAVAQTLGKTVVAEGVDSEIKLTHLQRIGVDTVQGFHLGRPLNADDFAHWLGKRLAGEALSASFIARALV